MPYIPGLQGAFLRAGKPTRHRGHSVKNQPRDKIGRFARIGRTVRKIKRNLNPMYHVRKQARRVHRTRRQYQRQELYQQYQLLVPPKPKRRKRRTK